MISRIQSADHQGTTRQSRYRHIPYDLPFPARSLIYGYLKVRALRSRLRRPRFLLPSIARPLPRAFVSTYMYIMRARLMRRTRRTRRTREKEEKKRHTHIQSCTHSLFHAHPPIPPPVVDRTDVEDHARPHARKPHVLQHGRGPSAHRESENLSSCPLGDH